MLEIWYKILESSYQVTWKLAVWLFFEFQILIKEIVSN